MCNTVEYTFEGQSIKEEIANSVTHGVGALLSLAATAVLVVFAAIEGDALKIVGVSIFGATLVILYTASTLYHGIQKPRVKHLFHIFDHSAIFTLIAGTYTPITLCAIRGEWGWSLFGVAWGLAVLGVIATAIFFERARVLSLILYIAMGWMVLVTGPRLLSALSGIELMWLISGGLLYTLGVYFYRKKTLLYHHMIWHLFVLAGSTCHFFMLLSIE
ncbi:MAG: hemolysin III family protein [Deltaproteobacteria bacterium]|nr:hemolysin III family protein [Deltaproteobacteria bacterium]MBN2673996.1 hemolysin III family protein [Deltaproteobacteria bacterium]